uniref:Uncharacterized protein n=1 Tax=Arundo donax TaxID=35708 RepID=A0A0A9D270_ARUDO
MLILQHMYMLKMMDQKEGLIMLARSDVILFVSYGSSIYDHFHNNSYFACLMIWQHVIYAIPTVCMPMHMGCNLATVYTFKKLNIDSMDTK